jgi:exosome complex RNA-binding protein Csl4
MAAKLICGLCQATLSTGKEGRGVAFAICAKCQAALKAEMKRPAFRIVFIPRAIGGVR